MKPGHVLALLVLLAGIAFGFAGGEYSTMDWWTLRRGVDAEWAAVERLQIEIDSLRAEAEALESDPIAQEREARERFGMLRPGEILYRVRPDTRPRP